MDRWLNYLPYLVVTSLFLVLWLGFDFNGLYGQDAHEYLRYSNALKTFLETGANPGDFFWPKLYPIMGTVAGFTGIPVGFALQMTSLFAMLGSIYFAQRSIQFLYQKNSSWFLLLAAATQVYFVRAGLVVMSDALAACFVMGFVYNYLRLRRFRNGKYFVWAFLFAIAAFFTRYAVLPLLAIPLIHGFWLLFRQWGKPLRVILTGLILVLIGVVFFAGLIAIDLSNSIVADWNPLHLFQRTFIFQSHEEIYWVPNGVCIWSNFAHVGYLSCGVFLFFWWRHWNFKLTFLWIGLLVYLVFLGGIGFQNQRFMVISHLLVLILLFPAFQALMLWSKERKIFSVFIVGTLLLNAAFFYYSFSKMFAMHRFEKQVASAIHTLEDDKTLYSFYITASLGSYDIPNNRVDLWEEEIEFKKGGYIVFNPEQFSDNTRVMKNWRTANRRFELKIIHELPENWNIYLIQ
ncbi:MAG: hypothetical protein ACFHU9_13000 [Fluviicola sp.]